MIGYRGIYILFQKHKLESGDSIAILIAMLEHVFKLS